MTILTPRTHYKPFEYPWAYKLYVEQAHNMHWRPEEVALHQDIQDFKEKLSKPEQEFIRKIFLFFTQSDCDIGQMYTELYLPVFKIPEIRMMLLSFANMESNHAQAYSHLADTLGFQEYEEFLEYPEMKEKHNYLVHRDADYPGELLEAVAVTSAFGEGLQLFGSFIMLLSFVERGLLPGMGDVLAWSMRDESIHVKGLTKIFHEIKQDYPEVWIDDVKRTIYQACRDMVELEDRFISLIYTDDLELPNLPKETLHEYIRYLADHRLGQLGLKPNYYVKDNPISWLPKFENSLHEDLFNNTGTEYSKEARDWSTAW